MTPGPWLLKDGFTLIECVCGLEQFDAALAALRARLEKQ
jgi:hypothetical protein